MGSVNVSSHQRQGQTSAVPPAARAYPQTQLRDPRGIPNAVTTPVALAPAMGKSSAARPTPARVDCRRSRRFARAPANAVPSPMFVARSTVAARVTALAAPPAAIFVAKTVVRFAPGPATSKRFVVRTD